MPGINIRIRTKIKNSLCKIQRQRERARQGVVGEGGASGSPPPQSVAFLRQHNLLGVLLLLLSSLEIRLPHFSLLLLLLLQLHTKLHAITLLLLLLFVALT